MMRRISYYPLGSVREAEQNPKLHHPHLVRSVERFGFADALVMDERTQRIVAGHGRLEGLRQMQESGARPPAGVKINGDGEWCVPVQRGWASSSDAEARAFLLAHNAVGEAGGWDADGLAQMLAGIDAEGLGFSDAEVAEMIAGIDVPESEPDTPEPDTPEPAESDPAESDPSESQRGEVYALGPHRLMCGDALDARDRARLLDGATPGVTILDPPFSRRRVGDAEWLPLLGDPTILFGQARHLRAVPDAMWRFERVLDKGYTHRCPTTGVGHRHAFIAQCGTGSAVPGSSDTFASIVQLRDEDRAHHSHGKPVWLLVEHLTYWTPHWEALVDWFSGGGASLLAAEQMGRVAYLMEIDPHTCDGIRARWGARE